MARLSSRRRRKLPKKSFALPGKRKYPIDTKKRARNALARVSQHGSPSQKRRVRAAVKRKYPSIGKKKSGGRRRKKR